LGSTTTRRFPILLAKKVEKPTAASMTTRRWRTINVMYGEAWSRRVKWMQNRGSLSQAGVMGQVEEQSAKAKQPERRMRWVRPLRENVLCCTPDGRNKILNANTMTLITRASSPNTPPIHASTNSWLTSIRSFATKQACVQEFLLVEELKNIVVKREQRLGAKRNRRQDFGETMQAVGRGHYRH